MPSTTRYVTLITALLLASCAAPARLVQPPEAAAPEGDAYVARAPDALDLAMSAHRDADWPGAIAAVEIALPYYESLADFRRQLDLLLIRAHALRMSGQRAAAHEDALRAQALLDATLMPLIGGRDDARAGDLPYLLAQAQHAGLPVAARSLDGDAAGADMLFATARAEYASFRQWDALSHLLRVQTARALDLGQLHAATASLKDALALDRARSAQRALALDLDLARQLAASVGEPELAASLARWAAPAAATRAPQETPLTRWETPAERAHALAALRSIRRDPARATRNPDLVAELRAAHDLAPLGGPGWELAAEIGGLLLEQGHVGAAQRYLDHAIASVEALRAQLATPRQREAHAAAHRELYIAALHALIGVDTDQRTQADYQRALAIVGKLKARGLLDHMSATASLASAPAPALSDALVAEEVADLLAPWLDRQRAVAPQALISPPASWPHPAERVVEYLISQRVGYVWVIHPGGIAMRRVAGWQTLGPIVDAWRADLARPDLSPDALKRWQARAQRLHVELIGPIEDLITPAAGLIIAPDGPLNDLPFEAFIKPSREQDPAYLFESFETRYTPSAAALTRAPRMASGDLALVMGAPTLDADALSLLSLSQPNDQRSAQLSKPRFATLPGARAEALRAGAQLSSLPGLRVQTLIGPRASEAALRRADLTRLRYLHISTHGLSDALPWSVPQPVAVRQPALLLAREDDAPEDGVLRLTEILRWRTGAELVVLSGCTTGRGWEELGAGAYGLAGAFLVAGAQSVVASAWDVSDEATAALMQGFYTHLAAGASPAAALRRARKRVVTPQRPPFYWAAFRIVT